MSLYNNNILLDARRGPSMYIRPQPERHYRICVCGIVVSAADRSLSLSATFDFRTFKTSSCSSRDSVGIVWEKPSSWRSYIIIITMAGTMVSCTMEWYHNVCPMTNNSHGGQVGFFFLVFTLTSRDPADGFGVQELQQNSAALLFTIPTMSAMSLFRCVLLFRRMIFQN